MIRRSIKWVAWRVVLLLVGGGILLSAPFIQARAASASQPHMRLDPTSLTATLESQRILAGKDALTNWSTASGDTFTVAGPQGSVLHIVASSATAVGGNEVSITPPLLGTSGISGDQAIALYRASGLSLSRDALAVGFSSAEVQQLVAENTAADEIINHVCINHTWTGGATVHACTIEYLGQHSGSNWYLAYKTVSSWAAAGHSALEQTREYVTYPSTNGRIDWSPDETISKGSCSTATFSISIPGASISFSRTICPETLSPYFPSNYGFGAVWHNPNGVCPGVWRNNPSLSGSYDTRGEAGSGFTLYVTAWWYGNKC